VGTKNILGRFPRHCNIRNIRIVYDQPTSIYTMTYIIETNASVNLGCDIMGRPLMFDKRMEKRIMFRVPDEVYEIYEQEAKLQEMTINQFIREIILNP